MQALEACIFFVRIYDITAGRNIVTTKRSAKITAKILINQIFMFFFIINHLSKILYPNTCQAFLYIVYKESQNLFRSMQNDTKVFGWMPCRKDQFVRKIPRGRNKDFRSLVSSYSHRWEKKNRDLNKFGRQIFDSSLWR